MYDSNGKASTITTTHDLAPGGATQLYLDNRFGTPIIRQLSVHEVWQVMGKPFPLDTSEADRREKLRQLGQSEDGHIVSAWAKTIRRYANASKKQTRYHADDSLNWSKEEAHARCLHLSDWCLQKLGLKKLGLPCKECALSGIRRESQSTNRPVPVPAKNYRWGCDIVGKFLSTDKTNAPPIRVSGGRLSHKLLLDEAHAIQVRDFVVI